MSFPGYSNLFLESIIESFPVKGQPMHVLSSDELLEAKKNIQGDFFAIVNTSRRGEVGTHFLSVIILKTKLLILDPLAQYIFLNEDFRSFVNGFEGRELCFLKQPVQSIMSHKCALFSLYFLYLFSDEGENISFEPFVSDLNKNECIVSRNLARIFAHLS